jgi:2-oxoglutarate/2-oxoacid ferredoxin oxidoreductase subunit beta
MVELKDYESTIENKWCPGCGNFGILAAMKDALVKQNIPPEKLLLVSGIGQAAKTPHFLQCNLFHGLHGRALPVATGAKIANHELTIIVNSGDGDCYGEGGNHFIHAVRRNVDITLLVHDNKIYGLTKGQASPTTDMGTKTRIQHHGVISEPFNPLTVSLSLGAGFVARGFSGDIDHLSGLIREGIKYNGFALIDILQPCVSFNFINTFKWYKNRVYNVNQDGYAPEDFNQAYAAARQWGDRIPIGIIYKKEQTSFTQRIAGLADGSLISRVYDRNRLQNVLSGL